MAYISTARHLITVTPEIVPVDGWVLVPQGVGTTLVRHGCETDFLAAPSSAANHALLTGLMSKHVCGQLTRSDF